MLPRERVGGALLGRARAEPPPALASLLAGRVNKTAQTAHLRKFLAGQCSGPTLVLVIHRVNITTLTGVFPQSGEILVHRNDELGLDLIGRLPAPVEQTTP